MNRITISGHSAEEVLKKLLDEVNRRGYELELSVYYSADGHRQGYVVEGTYNEIKN